MFGDEPAPFSGEGGDELRDEVWVHQLPTQHIEDMRLQMAAPDPGRVAARALLGLAAAQVVLAQGCKGGAAHPAHHFADKEILRSALLPEPVALVVRGLRSRRHLRARRPGPVEFHLHLVPQILVDDAKLWSVCGDNPSRIFLPAMEGARHGVLDDVSPVPEHPANVDRVAQQTVSTMRTAADGGVVPDPSGRARNPFRIERLRDDAWTDPCGVFTKDAPHHGCFNWIDPPQTPVWLAIGVQDADDVIPI